MKRMITKQMRDSFNLDDAAKISLFKQVDLPRCARKTNEKFSEAEKQRILTLRRVAK